MTTLSGAELSVDSIQLTVGTIVRTVLDRQDIDPTVDVFDQGATSLAFIRVLAQVNEKYGIAVDVAQLEEASIDSLSALVGAQTKSGNPLKVGDGR